MRKILALSLGVAATAAPPAAASTTLSASVKMTPGTAGTHDRPAGKKLTVKFDLATPGDEARPMVTGFEVWHGPGVAFDRGKGYAECRSSVMAKMGPDGCPPASQLGNSGPSIGDPGTLEPEPKFQLFNGPGRQPLAYITLQRPARVRAVAPFAMVRKPRSAWPNRMGLTFPQTLREVAGIPITMNRLRLTYGYTKAAKLYVSTDSCPRGGWAWRVRVHTERAGVLQQDGHVPCGRR